MSAKTNKACGYGDIMTNKTNNKNLKKKLNTACTDGDVMTDITNNSSALPVYLMTS